MTLEVEVTNEEYGQAPPPLVSAILAVRNEERYIEAVLRSLLSQDCVDCVLEIIVVDGDSTDGTPEIVARLSAADARVRLVTNTRKRTPFAFNLGLQASQGEYVCILGAHTTYAANYVSTCLSELKLQGAGGCSGRVVTRPGAEGLEARLIAWALAHPFGTSSGSTRTRGAGFWDTIPYPVFRKNCVLEVGGYDSRLYRNQDNDLNQRLRARGHKLYITDKTECELWVVPTFRALMGYAYRTGFWNLISGKKNLASMSLRHFVPGMFVLAMMFCLVAFGAAGWMAPPENTWLRVPLLLMCSLYLCAAAAASLQIGIRERSLAAVWLPAVFALLHLSYGVGTLSALVRNAQLPQSEDAVAPEKSDTSGLREIEVGEAGSQSPKLWRVG